MRLRQHELRSTPGRKFTFCLLRTAENPTIRIAKQNGAIERPQSVAQQVKVSIRSPYQIQTCVASSFQFMIVQILPDRWFPFQLQTVLCSEANFATPHCGPVHAIRLERHRRIRRILNEVYSYD